MPTPRRRTLTLVVAALLAIAIPAAAQTVFDDVPADHPFHDEVGEIVDAGITTGCVEDDSYCPHRVVRRGPMAAFLARTGSRVHGDSSATTFAAGDGNVNGVPVTVDVEGPGADGGEHQVALHGSVTVSATQEDPDCPCEVEAYVYRARGELVGPRSFATLDGTPAERSVSLPVTWATTIESGRTEQYRVAVFVDGTERTEGLRADGALTAVTAPFS